METTSFTDTGDALPIVNGEAYYYAVQAVDGEVPARSSPLSDPVLRVIIPVGVAYGSDTQLVHDLLMKAARDHKDVLSFPAPIVLFKAFGNSSLDFELRVYARDTDYYLTLINDMHFAIDKLFRENSIEIPFPQRDLHLRDSDTLAEVLRGGVTRKVTASQAEAAKGEQKGSPSGNGNDGD